MDALLQSVTQTVAQDVRELAHAPELRSPELVEIAPPQAHWGVPLGFVSLVAAGAVLIAVAGVQSNVQAHRHGARPARTEMHKRKVQALPPRPFAG